MKPSPAFVYPLRSGLQRFFRPADRPQLLHEATQGRRYARKVDPFALVATLLEAYLLLLPGLRAIVERAGARLGTPNISTLSYALGSPALARLATLMLDRLSWSDEQLGHDDIVVLDSMAVSLPATRQHNCARMNNKTVGGGVLWGVCVTACRGISPLRVLRRMQGAWSDAVAIQGIALAPRGPLHVMDQGFHKLDMMQEWLAQGVRFLVRARLKDLRFERLEVRGQAGRWLRAKPSARGGRRRARVLFDGVARLGVAQRKGARPVVRLLLVEITRGAKSEVLVLASSELELGAQALLDLYGRRWEIEEFHRLLKRLVGLAHLYSFRQRGIETLIALAALLAVLLWMARGKGGDEQAGQALVRVMRALVKAARAAHGMGTPWRPNIVGKAAWRHRA